MANSEIKNNQELENEKVNAGPTKRFFVSMLTRDIDLRDAILDLIDNCVDGILRTNKEKGIMKNVKEPYKGYFAKIELKENSFTISDNCGGIPIEIAKNYAFRMGKPLSIKEDLQTVGAYGIGMKRAIFKIGRECKVETKNSGKAYTVHFQKEWLEDDDNWDLPLTLLPIDFLKEDGTSIEIIDLEKAVSDSFMGANSFIDEFRKVLSSHYSLILQKGFEIELNGKKVNPKPLQLFFSSDNESEIAPYIYIGDQDGVKVTIAVGYFRPFPKADEEKKEEDSMGSEEAGWTIICNDRVVVFADKDHLTGWGENTVPRFHSQYANVAGYVIFQSKEPLKLPITTTKRNIEVSSPTFLAVKSLMIEAIKVFTGNTNKWKSPTKERDQISYGVKKSVTEIAKFVAKGKWKKVQKPFKGEKFTPSLPLPVVPKKKTDEVSISFKGQLSDIETVAEYFKIGPIPSDVGKKCFDEFVKISSNEGK